MKPKQLLTASQRAVLGTLHNMLEDGLRPTCKELAKEAGYAESTTFGVIEDLGILRLVDRRRQWRGTTITAKGVRWLEEGR